MLTRFVRTQLVVFTIASVIGLTAMVFGYMQVPTCWVSAISPSPCELPATGGLYRFGNVTYRGVQIGKVSPRRADRCRSNSRTLAGRHRREFPADVQANVRSVSAVGEQYVDLIPRGGGPPFLHRRLGDRDAATPRVPQQGRPGARSTQCARQERARRTSCRTCSTSRSMRSTAPATTWARCSTPGRASPPTPTPLPNAPGP